MRFLKNLLSVMTPWWDHDAESERQNRNKEITMRASLAASDARGVVQSYRTAGSVMQRNK